MELSAALYAMIRQLVNFLPARDAKTGATIDATRFHALDGTLRTWKEALGVFEDLVNGARLPLILFVIHGLNVLEEDFEHTTADALQDLFHCFTRISDHVPRGVNGECARFFSLPLVCRRRFQTC